MEFLSLLSIRESPVGKVDARIVELVLKGVQVA